MSYHDKLAKHFKLCQAELPRKRLYQKDFKDGPVTLNCPGVYTVEEDITFDFQADNDYRPPDSSGRAFSLGFFAGIIITGKNIILDLQGHTVKQSEAFALQQRFFAIIELASAPFIPRQGPSNFGNKIKSAKYCLIKNGTLGRSSHHGIHGNGVRGCVLHNLCIRDFEIAGVALNGGKVFHFDNLTIGPNAQDIPVLGTYSASRFLPQFYEQIREDAETNNEWVAGLELKTKLDNLLAANQQVFDEVAATGKTTVVPFANECGLTDGNNYGILIGPIGVAVNEYIDQEFKGKYVKHVKIDETLVHDIVCKPIEVVGLCLSDNKGKQNDSSGSVFRIEDVADLSDSKSTYSGNVLTEAQLCLAAYGLKYSVKIGRMNITQDVVDWAANAEPLSVLTDKGYTFKYSGDMMNHLSKPIIGYRFDAVKCLYLGKTKLIKMENKGRLGEGSYIVSHDAQKRPGYRGNAVVGYDFSRVIKVKIGDIFVKDLSSYNGEVIGFRVINNSAKLQLYNYRITNLTVGYAIDGPIVYGINKDDEKVELTCSYPNAAPAVMAIEIEGCNTEVEVSHQLHRITALEPSFLAFKIAHR
jgi:hypothetical protein